MQIQPSVGYIRMNAEFALSALEDLDAESGRSQWERHLREILHYLSAINCTENIEAVYLRVVGGKDRIRAKRLGEHFEVSD